MAKRKAGPTWQQHVDSDHLAFFNSRKLAQQKKSMLAVQGQDDAETDRQHIAAAITAAKFGTGPDHDISDTWTGVGEPDNTVAWLNGPIANSVYTNSPYWAWVTCTGAEVSKTKTMQDFAQFCYLHLAPKVVKQ